MDGRAVTATNRRWIPLRPAAGLTLLELTVTLAVAAVLCAIALPGLQPLLDRQRAASARQLLSSHLAFARLATIQQRQAIRVCASIDGTTCSGDANGWAAGWIVHRTGPDGGPATAEGPALRHHTPGYPPGWTIRSSDGRRHLRFLPDGRAWGTNLTLQICVRGDLMAEVVVNNSGRVRSESVRRPGGCPP